MECKSIAQKIVLILPFLKFMTCKYTKLILGIKYFFNKKKEEKSCLETLAAMFYLVVCFVFYFTQKFCLFLPLLLILVVSGVWLNLQEIGFLHP